MVWTIGLQWLKQRNQQKCRRIFVFDGSEPNFDLPMHTHFQRNANACYEVYFLQMRPPPPQGPKIFLNRRPLLYRFWIRPTKFILLNSFTNIRLMTIYNIIIFLFYPAYLSTREKQITWIKPEWCPRLQRTRHQATVRPSYPGVTVSRMILSFRVSLRVRLRHAVLLTSVRPRLIACHFFCSHLAFHYMYDLRQSK